MLVLAGPSCWDPGVFTDQLSATTSSSQSYPNGMSNCRISGMSAYMEHLGVGLGPQSPKTEKIEANQAAGLQVTPRYKFLRTIDAAQW